MTERGVTIFLTSHVLEIVERLCSHVAIIDKENWSRRDRSKSCAPGASAEGRTTTLEEIFLSIVGKAARSGSAASISHESSSAFGRSAPPCPQSKEKSLSSVVVLPRRSHPGAQLFERSLRDQFSLVDDRHVAAEPLDNFQNVRSQEDLTPALRHSSKKRFQLRRLPARPLLQTAHRGRECGAR